MRQLIGSLRKWIFLLILALCSVSFFYFHLYKFLNPHTLKIYQAAAKHWTLSHYKSAITLYILFFTILIACAIPCATFFTLLGGFLFGAIAILYAELGTTMGGLVLFLAIRTSIGTGIANRTSGWIKKMEHGFQQNAFHYLLTLRLVPIFPCWLCNISAGALNVPLRTFLFTTIIGIFPATFIYVMAGRGLDKLFLANYGNFKNLIFTPSVLFPLIGLALFSLLPVIYKQFNQRA
jgi:uncharacterized membrane protein YdjX (TVP38/TMEM64 family)